jgi:hypothetical protein
MLTAMSFKPKAIAATLAMIEKTPRAGRMSEKELRARIDRVIAEEERTYGRLIELRDLFHAITGELESPDGQLAEHLEHCCYAIAVSPEQAMITPLCAAFLRRKLHSAHSKPGGAKRRNVRL